MKCKGSDYTSLTEYISGGKRAVCFSWGILDDKKGGATFGGTVNFQQNI